MTFTVTHRDASGAVCLETVEAASRGDCFAQMKARGITPIGVKEGRSMSGKERKGYEDSLMPKERDGRFSAGAKEKPGGKSVMAKVALVAALAVVVGGAWWMLRGDKGAARTERPVKADKPAEVKVKRPAAVKAALLSTNAAVTVAATNEVKEAAKPKERHDTVSIHTNNMGKVVEKWIGADGKLHMSVRYARKPVFDNASDDQLAMAVGGEGTREIPPIPMAATSEQEFLESLKKPIEIAEDDPEEVKRLKQAVSEARAEMKALMDRGMSYREALAEHQRLVNENVDTRNQCMAELKSLVDAGDREGAEHYLKTMNVALEQMGIPALTMPMSREELNAARQRRKEEREAAKQGGK